MQKEMDDKEELERKEQEESQLKKSQQEEWVTPYYSILLLSSLEHKQINKRTNINSR